MRGATRRRANLSACSARQQGPEVVLEVRDHGSGIPRDELPHVFERFWRGTAGAREAPVSASVSHLRNGLWTGTAAPSPSRARPKTA